MGINGVDQLREHRRRAAAMMTPQPEEGKFASDLYKAAESSPVNPEEYFDAFAKKILAHGGGDAPSKPPVTRRQNILVLIIMVLIGPGGALAVIYGTSNQSKENSEDVNNLKPRMDNAEKSISAIETSIGAIETSNKSISSGIEELKEKNVKRLENELEDAKREIRRLR